jgi:cobalamin biosynthesis protein CobD/CbiB
MYGDRRFTRYVCYFVVVTMLLMCLRVQTVRAAIIKTETVLTQSTVNDVRENLNQFLKREDVQAIMTAQGISPVEAIARVDSLSDDEIMQIADKLDQLPAGGTSTIGVIVIASVIVFIVLLITDILGFTDIFTFVKHPSRK